MSPSFDLAASSLLCTEEEDYSIFCDEEYSEPTWHHEDRRFNRQTNGLDSFSGLPLQSDECIALMVKKESEHLPAADYLNRLRNGDLEARKEAIEWILKVVAHFNFGPLCAYLAISYLDRFLSAYDLPKGKAWMMQLLAVACLSLAAKMEETEVPLCLDLQVGESKFVFEARTIQRMELSVLSALKWRMQAITPFSFIDHFLYKINGDKIPPKCVIFQSTQLILSIIKGIDFLGLRPSEVAAAVAISVAEETQTVEVEKSIPSLTEYVEKVRVLKCVEIFQRSSMISGCIEDDLSGSVPSVPHSPIGVLDVGCLSYKTDDESTVGSCVNYSHISLGTKRRKLDIPSEVKI